MKMPHVVCLPSCGKSSGLFPVWDSYEMVIFLLPSSSRNDIAGTHRTPCLKDPILPQVFQHSVLTSSLKRQSCARQVSAAPFSYCSYCHAQGPGFWLVDVLV